MEADTTVHHVALYMFYTVTFPIILTQGSFPNYILVHRGSVFEGNCFVAGITLIL